MTNTFSYDRLAYPAKFFVQASPDRLAANAALFGVQPADVKTCRVLELGCGSGWHLISQAFLLPDAEFVGIDLGKQHIDEAKAEAGALGLTNVEFAQMDVMELSAATFGKFDYIVAHGLFSWVPDAVREKVLQIYSELLNENGVGYISYNAGPGAFSRYAARWAMNFHTSEMDDPVEKVEEALSFLDFLSESAADKTIYKAELMHEVQRHKGHHPADIFHDDLSEFNKTFFIKEFADLLDEAGLQFLAEAELHMMGLRGLSSDAVEFVETAEDIIDREQYLDLIRNRTFRQSLVCHKNRQLDHSPKPSALDAFYMTTSLRPQNPDSKYAETKREKFIGPKNEVIEIDLPLAKAALVHLGNVSGKAVRFGELIDKAEAMIIENGRQIEKKDEQTDAFRKILLQLVRSTDLVTIHKYQPAAKTELSAKPRISELARRQLTTANNILTNFNLDIELNDSVSRKTLELLDGTRDLDQVAKELAEFINTNKIPEIENKKTFIRELPKWLKDNMTNLARFGTFVE